MEIFLVKLIIFGIYLQSCESGSTFNVLCERFPNSDPCLQHIQQNGNQLPGGQGNTNPTDDQTSPTVSTVASDFPPSSSTNAPEQVEPAQPVPTVRQPFVPPQVEQSVPQTPVRPQIYNPPVQPNAGNIGGVPSYPGFGGSPYMPSQYGSGPYFGGSPGIPTQFGGPGRIGIGQGIGVPFFSGYRGVDIAPTMGVSSGQQWNAAGIGFGSSSSVNFGGLPGLSWLNSGGVPGFGPGIPFFGSGMGVSSGMGVGRRKRRHTNI